MNSAELNKIMCVALFSSLLIFGLNILGGIVYAPNTPDKPAYSVEVAESAAPSGGGGDEGGAAAEPDIATLLASADPAKGEKVAKKCTACHTFESGGKDGIGPNLYGLPGKNKGISAGFGYSDALKGKGGAWDFAALNAFLNKPKDYIPGTKMAFAGLKKATDRANLIAYLNTKTDSPLPLPTPAPAAAPAADPAMEKDAEPNTNKQGSITPSETKPAEEKKAGIEQEDKMDAKTAEGIKSDNELITGTVPVSLSTEQTSTAGVQEQKKNKAQNNL